MVELFENKKNILPKEWQISFFDPPIKTLSKGHFYGYYNFFNYLSKEMIIGAYLIGLGTKLSNGYFYKLYFFKIRMHIRS